MGRVVVKNELSNPTQSTGTWNNDIPYCRLDSYLIAANLTYFPKRGKNTFLRFCAYWWMISQHSLYGLRIVVKETFQMNNNLFFFSSICRLGNCLPNLDRGAQGPVVWKVDNAIHRINRYPVDKCRQNKPRCPLDQIVIYPVDRFSAFEQLGPGLYLTLNLAPKKGALRVKVSGMLLRYVPFHFIYTLHFYGLINK